MLRKNDEISSTERLLNVIRDDSEVEDEMMEISPPELIETETKFSFSNVFFIRRIVNVGVIIGESYILLAMTRQSIEGKWELLDYTRVSCDSKLKKDSRSFISFLDSTLTDFCGSQEHCNIWTTIYSSKIETRYLMIPKVSEKQIANAVYWTYKKQVSFDEGEVFFDYEVLGDTSEEGVRKTKIIAYSAPSEEVKKLKNLFVEAGFPLTGIAIAPFAIQNIFKTNLIKIESKNNCVLYIGKDQSRIDIFSEQNLVLSRDIKTGINSIVDAIKEELDSIKSESSMELVEAEDGSIVSQSDVRSPVDMKKAEQMLKCLADDQVSELSRNVNKITGQDFTEKDIMGMIIPALIRLVRQMERTLEYFSSHFGGESVRKFYISGELCGYKNIIGFIGDQLNCRLDYIDPFPNDFISTDNDTTISLSDSEKDAFAMAVGMGVSDNAHTPNLLYTFRQKGVQSNIRTINKAVFAVFIIVMIVLSGIFVKQENEITRKKAMLTVVQQQIAKYHPRVDKQFIKQFVAKMGRDHATVNAYAKKYLGMAVISELSAMTPENISLINISANMGSARQNGEVEKFIIIEGVIFEDQVNRDSSLAVYLVKLNGSPIFENPRIVNKTVELFEDREVLKFKAKLELV